MALALQGADTSWPSEAELVKVNEIRQICSQELSALSDQPRDVVGDLRLARFLRFYSGDVAKAAKGYSEFLTFRVREGIEEMRKGVIDLNSEDYLAWVNSVRSPYSPPICPRLGETAEGHILLYAAPGYFKALDFLKERPACHTMDTDLLIVWMGAEWVLKQLEDRSYREQKMLYTIKVIDMTNLGKEKIPILVPELRSFAKTNVPPLMNMYCEHDILIMIVNAPWVFRIVWAFASTLLSKRQQKRVRVFSDVFAAEPQALLKSLAPADVWPRSVGGSREVVPLAFPFEWQKPGRVEEFKRRTAPGIEKGKAPTIDLDTARKAAAEATTPASTAPGGATIASPTDTSPQDIPMDAQSLPRELQQEVVLEGKEAAAPRGCVCCASAS